ncbi:MAG: hypothetical protein A2020_02985 [Lentisphaerae bacterium GWF2_45_14]|nr:MAG: hypothetical protein A2020_02985 [Lentisphaerae bacterium GWF2_45_14]
MIVTKKKAFSAGILFSVLMAMGFFCGATDEVVYSLDFAKARGNPVSYLARKGFVLKKDADDLSLSFKNGALELAPPSPLFGVIINDSIHINDFSKIRIEWGILEYPEGASYEKDINNEAIMVYIFFGDKKLSSDSLFIPNSPYFIGLFLGQHDVSGKMYTGHHFTAGGRFVCVGSPKQGETVTTEFELKPAFKKYFNQVEVPFVSGISLEVDTSYLDNGQSKAFIKKIEILK